MKDGQAESNSKTVQIQGSAVEILGDFPVQVSCMEHFDQILDEYVDQYEVAPYTYKRSDVDEPGVPASCKKCGAAGVVVLLKVKGS